MSSSYVSAEALREATGLAGTEVFAEFCVSLEAYVLSGTGEAALRQCSAAAADEARGRRLAPERMLHALRIRNCRSARIVPTESLGKLCDARYTHAISLFLGSYFAA